MTAQRPLLYVGFAQPDEWGNWAGTYARHAARFEECAGRPCLTVSFLQADTDLVRRLEPSAIVLSGFARSFEQYAPASLEAVCSMVLDVTNVPMLAVCGSHQLLGYLYNGELEGGAQPVDRPMRLRKPGEPALNPHYHPDYFMEIGFHELDLHGCDPLFATCGAPPAVCESHYCEIKRLPPGFRLLASTPECRIQAMRHEERPLVGVQFHPEDWTDRFPDGRAVLQAFFAQGPAAPDDECTSSTSRKERTNA
jgi:GMP synthase-like glutamine amidotransferase